MQTPPEKINDTAPYMRQSTHLGFRNCKTTAVEVLLINRLKIQSKPAITVPIASLQN